MSSGPAAPGVPRTAADVGTPTLLVVTVVVIAAVAATAALLIPLLIRGRGLRRRVRLLAIGIPTAFALPLGALGVGTALAGKPVPASAPVSESVRSAPAQPLMRPHGPAALAEAVDTPWSTLLGIENALITAQNQLAANEGTIGALRDTLTQAPATDQKTRHPGGAARLIRELTRLVAGHQALETTYEQSLQREYVFFLATAQSAPQSVQLQTAASSAPTEVTKAVSYDLTTVQTQLAQQAAVTAAAAAALNVTVPVQPHGRMPAFHAPLSGVVTQSFGPSQLTLEPPITFDGVFYPHFHTGLDIAAPLDAPVGASAAGTVILAGASRDGTGALVGYGNYVVISHGNGVLTLYGHLDQILVQVGQGLRQGQVIGLCGSTGWSTGPHVHFEIRIKGQYVDPAPLLGGDLRLPR
jgi:murein DD-endopeptidase MepM/ murein hydrolase activator NlpD